MKTREESVPTGSGDVHSVRSHVRRTEEGRAAALLRHQRQRHLLRRMVGWHGRARQERARGNNGRC